jgi:MFS family permease
MLKIFSKRSINKRELSNLFLFSWAKFVSLFGSSIYTFALGLYVLKTTGSGLSFSITLVVSILPTIIVSPFAGVLADKLNKKLLVVTMDSLNGVLLTCIYFLSRGFGLSLYMIYVSTLLISVISTIFDMSLQSAVPNIVSNDKLLKINSISKVIESVSSICGPMIGGLVFAFIDIRLFILINGISFILGASSEIFMDFKFNMDIGHVKCEKISMFKDIFDAFKYIQGKIELKKIIILLISLNFFIGLSLSVPLPYILNKVLKINSYYFGIIEGACPLGMIIGAMLVKKIFDERHFDRLLLILNSIFSILIMLIALPILFSNFHFNLIFINAFYIIIMLCVGIVISLIDVPVFYILQKTIDPEFRARVLSLGMSLVKIASPIALILSGALIGILQPSILPILGGSLSLLFVIIFNRS